MYYEQIKDLHFFKFDSMDETAREATKASKPFRNDPWDSIHNSNFTGRAFGSYEEVIEATNQLWPKGMDIYQNMINELHDVHFQPPHNIRRRPAWSEDSGDELCLDRLRTSQPYWRTTRRDHRPGPLSITIITDTATPGIKNHQNILWRGAAAVCLTELLEKAGYRVEMWQAQHLARAFHRKPGKFASASLLKRTTDPLDVSTLINATSGWMQRTIFFAVLSLIDRPANAVGLPIPLKPIISLITNDSQTILSEEVWSRKDAVGWVRQQLTKFESGEFAAQV